MEIKCGKKLKQMLKFFTCRTENDVVAVHCRSSPPPRRRAVHCEELFLPRRGNKNGYGDHQHRDEDDPYVAAFVAAQNHFSRTQTFYI
ncbi:hypothetical protein LINPERPRIM_LOCUS14126 [Linum perenne]